MQRKPIGWTLRREGPHSQMSEVQVAFYLLLQKPCELLCGHAICEQCFNHHKLPGNEVDWGYKYGIVCPLSNCPKSNLRDAVQFQGIVKGEKKKVLVDADGFQKGVHHREELKESSSLVDPLK
ncbi:unnamed protein product, partial [Mesorhabditis belari]|uniref:Uncharacterized protein n=1 Tax=Mesorhabditis belari TaxID=2138241 RepID=A0AAF3F6C4_9BILA